MDNKQDIYAKVHRAHSVCMLSEHIRMCATVVRVYIFTVYISTCLSCAFIWGICAVLVVLVCLTHEHAKHTHMQTHPHVQAGIITQQRLRHA